MIAMCGLFAADMGANLRNNLNYFLTTGCRCFC